MSDGGLDVVKSERKIPLLLFWSSVVYEICVSFDKHIYETFFLFLKENFVTSLNMCLPEYVYPSKVFEVL